MVQAMGRCYHPVHFLCAACGTVIGQGRYMESQEQPLCQPCYAKNYSPKCDGCGLPIEAQLLTAVGKQWHTHCFVCHSCSLPFAAGQFYERGGQPVCGNCYQRAAPAAPVPVLQQQQQQSQQPVPANTPRCRACQQPIFGGNALQALNALWHQEHFVCQVCAQPFQAGQFYELHGAPLCPQHYMAATGGRT